MKNYKKLFMCALLGLVLAGCSGGKQKIENVSQDNQSAVIQSSDKETEKVIYKECETWPPVSLAYNEECVVSSELAKDIITQYQFADILAKHDITPLMWAKDVEAARILLCAGADVNAKSTWEHQKTALMYAAQRGNAELVRVLLDAGADVWVEDKNNKTAIMYAAENGNVEIVRMLIDARADVNGWASEGGSSDVPGVAITVLGYAAESGNVEVVRMLLEAGADGHCPSVFAPDVLIFGVESKNVEIVRLLLEAGIDSGFGKSTALRYASKNGNLEMVRLLLESGVSVMGARGGDLMESAIDGGNLEIIRLLIDAGASMNLSEDADVSLLCHAARNGSAELVRFLLDNGADVNQSDPWGSALMSAAQYKNPEAIRVLLEAGADVNATDYNGETALVKAVRDGNAEIVRMLLDAGAASSVNNKIDDDGRTVLIFALEADNSNNEVDDVAVVRALLDAGADVNVEYKDRYSSSKTALVTAVEKDKAEIVRMLLDAGARVATDSCGNDRDERYCNALSAAFVKGNLVIIHMLQDATGDVVDADEKYNALKFGAQTGKPELVRLFLDAGAGANDVSDFTDMKRTLLMSAARDGNTEVVRMLLDAGEDVNATSEIWGSVLARGAQSGNADVVRMLLDAGADVRREENRGTVLVGAAASGNVDIIRMLLDAGADVNDTDKIGVTPLYSAVENSQVAAVKMLIEAGADINVKGDVENLLVLAVRKGNPIIVRLLIDAGADVHMKGRYDELPIDIAERRNDRAIIALLKNAEAGTAISKDGSPNNDNISDCEQLHARQNSEKTQYWNALSQAIDNKNVDEIKKLIASKFGESRDNQLLFLDAINFNRPDLLRGLLMIGERFQRIGVLKHSLLMVNSNNPEFVQTLIDAGEDVNATDYFGVSVLMFAAAGIKMEKNMLNSLMRIDNVTQVKVDHYKMVLLSNGRKGNVESVRRLIQANANVNASDKEGMTALMYAAAIGNTQIVHELIKAGANVNAASDKQMTALTLAAENGSAHVVRGLIDAGANVNASLVDHSTVLMRAVLGGYSNIVRMLIDAGADVNASDGTYTVLDIAQKFGNTVIIRMLVDAGAKSKNKA